MNTTSIEYELRESKNKIESQINKEVTTFSYPYAFPEHDKKFKNIIKKTLEKCGYDTGVTTNIGLVKRGDDVLLLKRIPVNMHDDLSLFRAKLRGAYDWISYPQKIVKSIKFYKYHYRKHILK
jgi:hypothetical protein